MGQEGLLVDQISDKTSSNQPDHNRKWHGRRGGGERDTSNEDNSLETLSQDGNEWEYKHGILRTPSLERALIAFCSYRLVFQSFHKLDTPFLLHLRDTEKASTEDADDERSKDGE